MSTPDLSMGRTSSQTVLRKKTQELKVERPPLPKQVRFTFGNPPEVQAGFSQVIHRIEPRCLDTEINGFQSMVEQFQVPDKDWRNFDHLNTSNQLHRPETPTV